MKYTIDQFEKDLRAMLQRLADEGVLVSDIRNHYMETSTTSAPEYILKSVRADYTYTSRYEA